jgi:hypothetical protein
MFPQCDESLILTLPGNRTRENLRLLMVDVGASINPGLFHGFPGASAIHWLNPILDPNQQADIGA